VKKQPPPKKKIKNKKRGEREKLDVISQLEKGE
jgi:hypothetical protein